MAEGPPKGWRGALIFDRDGVLNLDVGYPHRPEQITWVPGAAAAVRAANAAGLLVGVATNQAGVARGYFHEADVVALHQWMSQALAEQGARIDAFAFCPHHPQGVVLAYRRDCDCRKPAPGMIQRLLGLFDVEPRFAAMIGDKDSDLEAARAAGVEAVRFTEGSLMDTAGPVIDRLVGLTQVIESPMASSS